MGKKISIFLGILGVILLGGSFAQESIYDAAVGFCDNGTGNITNTLTLQANPGTEKNICIYFQNKGEKPLQVVYDFSTALITKGGNQICDAGNGFTRFLKPLPQNQERKILLVADTAQIVRETLLAPVGMSGMQYGCLTYTIAQPAVTNMGGMFDLVVRKTIPLNLFVGGENEIKNEIIMLPISGNVFSFDKKVGADFSLSEGLSLKLLIKNNGNTAQNVSLSGKIFNALGFEKEFSAAAKKIIPGETLDFNTLVGILPSYKGIYTVMYTIKGDPIFEFDVSSMSKKFTESVFIQNASKIFLFSWILVIVPLILLLVLIKLFMSRNKRNNKK